MSRYCFNHFTFYNECTNFAVVNNPLEYNMMLYICNLLFMAGVISSYAYTLSMPMHYIIGVKNKKTVK